MSSTSQASTARAQPSVLTDFNLSLFFAVLGVGLVNRQANWGLMKPIGLAWVITLPAAAILAALFFIVMSSLAGSV